MQVGSNKYLYKNYIDYHSVWNAVYVYCRCVVRDPGNWNRNILSVSCDDILLRTETMNCWQENPCIWRSVARESSSTLEVSNGAVRVKLFIVHIVRRSARLGEKNTWNIEELGKITRYYALRMFHNIRVSYFSWIYS